VNVSLNVFPLSPHGVLPFPFIFQGAGVGYKIERERERLPGSRFSSSLHVVPTGPVDNDGGVLRHSLARRVTCVSTVWAARAPWRALWATCAPTRWAA
jgi:hypothetical protein